MEVRKRDWSFLWLFNAQYMGKKNKEKNANSGDKKLMVYFQGVEFRYSAIIANYSHAAIVALTRTRKIAPGNPWG